MPTENLRICTPQTNGSTRCHVAWGRGPISSEQPASPLSDHSLSCRDQQAAAQSPTASPTTHSTEDEHVRWRGANALVQ